MMLCIALDSNIEIRSLELADAPAVESLREGFTSHGDEWLYRGSAQEFIESALSDDSASGCLNIGIFELGQLVGVVICTIDAEQKSVRFDYMLGNRYRGRGLAIRAIKGLLEHFFTACGFLEASIFVDPENQSGPNAGSTEDEVYARIYNNGAIDAMMALILAHAVAGIDVTMPSYIEGIETALEGLSNAT